VNHARHIAAENAVMLPSGEQELNAVVDQCSLRVAARRGVILTTYGPDADRTQLSNIRLARLHPIARAPIRTRRVCRRTASYRSTGQPYTPVAKLRSTPPSSEPASTGDAKPRGCRLYRRDRRYRRQRLQLSRDHQFEQPRQSGRDHASSTSRPASCSGLPS
jgi:hypothetical protein